MNLIVVKIEKYSSHPNAQKLGICEVSDGINHWSVVCGAKNAKENIITILAPIGSTTPQGLQIQPAEIRGVKSFGMLCSPKDLNISNETGIVDLPKSTKLGLHLKEISPDLLSSTPWYSYQEVECLFIQQESKQIIRRSFPYQPIDKTFKPLSKTYFHAGQYLYRNFL